jgi:hypothetical protein
MPAYLRVKERWYEVEIWLLVTPDQAAGARLSSPCSRLPEACSAYWRLQVSIKLVLKARLSIHSSPLMGTLNSRCKTCPTCRSAAQSFSYPRHSPLNDWAFQLSFSISSDSLIKKYMTFPAAEAKQPPRVNVQGASIFSKAWRRHYRGSLSRRRASE